MGIRETYSTREASACDYLCNARKLKDSTNI